MATYNEILESNQNEYYTIYCEEINEYDVITKSMANVDVEYEPYTYFTTKDKISKLIRNNIIPDYISKIKINKESNVIEENEIFKVKTTEIKLTDECLLHDIEWYKIFVEQMPELIEYLKIQTPELINIAVSKNGLIIDKIDEEWKNEHTNKLSICNNAKAIFLINNPDIYLIDLALKNESNTLSNNDFIELEQMKNNLLESIDNTDNNINNEEIILENKSGELNITNDSNTILIAGTAFGLILGIALSLLKRK